MFLIPACFAFSDARASGIVAISYPWKSRSRVGLRHLDQCDSGVASNVCDFGPGLPLGDDSIELRQRARNELCAVPRSQQSLDSAIHFRAELIVGQSHTALE